MKRWFAVIPAICASAIFCVPTTGVCQAASPPVSCLSTQLPPTSGAPPGWELTYEPGHDKAPEIKSGGPRLLDDGSLIIIPLQIARIADDNGSRQAHLTPDEAQEWINYANIAFSPANIQFSFDRLSSFATIPSTLVNGMTGVGDANWDAERKAANHIAASFPGRMTLIVRWGPGPGPTGGGFSWWDYNYVTMPGFNNTWLCGQQNINLCAHEIGHHLGLPHTFWATYDTVSEAAADFATLGNNPDAYDGDGIADTPPHPTINEQACVTPDTFLLNGVQITNAKSNIMSYFLAASTVSPQQSQRARWLALNYSRNAMLGPSNQGVTNMLEAEDLNVVDSTSVSYTPQGMRGFGPDGWSANSQLFMSFNNNSATITLRIDAPSAGTYRIELYATQAPDYGNVQCAIDGQNIGPVIDGYAPVVVPTGLVNLVTTNLAAGNHNLTLTRAGKDPLSTGYLFGLDAVRLVNAAIVEPPLIRVQPLSQIVDAGAIVRLHTAATGTSLQYQWKKDGENIPGASQADYYINPATPADSADYSVAITNSAGFAISMPATLTVNAAPISAEWTGASGMDILWSNTNNWSPTRLPESHTDVYFDNMAGFTSAPGNVGSVVDVSLTVQRLGFDARAPHYHTLKLDPGVTLSVHLPPPPPIFSDTLLSVSAATGPTEQEVVTLLGPGAALVLGDTNAPVLQGSTTATEPGAGLEVWLSSSTGGNQEATLDMSGLDHFVYSGGYVRVGGHSSRQSADAAARGTLLLAKTNFILAGNAYNTELNMGGVVVGYRSPSNVQATDRGDLRLGLMNWIETEYIKVGGNRNCTGMMSFQASVLASNPQLILRNALGTGRVPFVEIGDSSRQTVDADETSYGTVDLSGGRVDAWVNNLTVGRSLTSTSATGTRGHGNGTLTWTDGTMDATLVYIGAQGGNNNGLATGVVNVRGNASLTATAVDIGNDAGDAAGTGNGALIVDGGTVDVVDLRENNGLGGNGSSTLIVTNGGRVNATGEIIVDSVTLQNGTITNGGTLVTAELRGNGTIHGDVSLIAGGTLSPGLSIGSLTVNKDLSLAAGSTSIFEANLDTLTSDTVVGMNNVAYGGMLIVTNIGGVTARTNGATLKLFNANDYLDTFAGFSLPPPGPGLHWNIAGLTNGTLRLESTIATTPVPLQFQLTESGLDISWPVNHTGWRLESQTNSVAVGLSNNWFTVAGSTASNHFVVPIHPIDGSVFYRLTYP